MDRKVSGTAQENSLNAPLIIIAYKADRNDPVSIGQELGRATADASTGAWVINVGTWDKHVFCVAIDPTTPVRFQAQIKDWMYSMVIQTTVANVVTLDSTVTDAGIVLSGGDLIATSSALAIYRNTYATVSRFSLKYAFEVTINTKDLTNADIIGIHPNPSLGIFSLGSLGNGIGVRMDRSTIVEGVTTATVAPVLADGATVMFLVDFINETVKIKVSTNGATETLIASELSETDYYPSASLYQSSSFTFNFGATAFVNSLPVGFTAWKNSPLIYANSWRALITANNGGAAVAMAEMKLYDLKGNLIQQNPLTLGVAVKSSELNGTTEAAANAFDSSLTTDWSSQSPAVYPEHIGYQYDFIESVGSIGLIPVKTGGVTNEAPMTIQFQYANLSTSGIFANIGSLVTSQTGWIAGEERIWQLQTSTDLIGDDEVGEYWVNHSSNAFSSKPILSVAANNDFTLAIVVGETGLINRSVDGGVNWVLPTVNPIASDNITGVTCSSDGLKAIACTGASRVIYSTNLGINWTESASAYSLVSPQGLYDVVISPDAAIAIAVGTVNTIIRSTDQGATWTNATTRPFTQSVRKVAIVPDKSLAIAVGNLGQIARSLDQGVTWTLATTDPFNSEIVDVAITDSKSLAIAVGTNTGNIPIFARSTDQGVTWTKVEVPLIDDALSIRCCAMTPSGDCIFVSVGKSIDAGSEMIVGSIDGGLTFKRSVNHFNVFLGQTVNGIVFSNDGNKAIAVGGGGTAGMSEDTAVAPACTWNALDKDPDIVLSNGNLNATTAPSAWGAVRATIGKSSGLRYFTVTAVAVGAANVFIGIASASVDIINRYVGQTGATGIKGASLYSNGQIWQNWAGSQTQTAGSAYPNGTVVGVLVDWATNTLKFYNDTTGVQLATVTNAAITGTFFPAVSLYGGGTISNLNGNGPFANLPVGAIAWAAP